MSSLTTEFLLCTGTILSAKDRVVSKTDSHCSYATKSEVYFKRNQELKVMRLF